MLNVLVVDDDRIVLEGLHRFVDWESLGFQMIGSALSAKEAMEIIQTECVDVLMTDIMMPQEDGFQLIEDALMVNPSLKTVILSSYSEFDYAKRAFRLGSFDYLTKPIDFDELKELFTRLYKILEKETTDRRNILQSKIQVLEDASPELPPDKEETIGPVIENVINFIHQHFNENLTLQSLSEIAYVHPAYLSKLFKEKTGSNFIDYLTSVRIEKAKVLLRDISLRVYDISDMVGYSSPKHFSKLFKDTTGLTPRDYRKNCHIEAEDGDTT
jgi:two-component system response regulator YesN